MRSRRNQRFDRAYKKLSQPVKELAQIAYKRFRDDPFDPRLSFHDIKGTEMPNIYAADVGTHLRVAYRALAVWDKQENIVVWFWIGSHEDYNNIISRL